MTENTLSVEQAVDTLNKLLAEDKKAISKLFTTRVTPVDGSSLVVNHEGKAGLLGVINSLFDATQDKDHIFVSGRVLMAETDESIVGFYQVDDDLKVDVTEKKKRYRVRQYHLYTQDYEVEAVSEAEAAGKVIDEKLGVIRKGSPKFVEICDNHGIDGESNGLLESLIEAGVLSGRAEFVESIDDIEKINETEEDTE